MRLVKKLNMLLVTGTVSGILMACGGPSSDIAGTWVNEKGHEMVFYEDGTCMDVPEYEISPSNDPESYKIQEDGNLILTLSYYGDKVVFERAESKEAALDDDDTYYLKGDELVFKQKIYTRE